jgi:hypothetical protein
MSRFDPFLVPVRPNSATVDLAVRLPPSDQDDLREQGLDLLQMALDLAGIIDPTPVCDGSAALLALARGQWFDAAISAVGILPYIGDLAKIGKLPKYLKIVEKAVALAERSVEAMRVLVPGLRQLERALALLPSIGHPLILQIKQVVRRALARHSARIVERVLPDISKKFKFYRANDVKFLRRVAEGRLGVPKRVFKHSRDGRLHKKFNARFKGDDAGHLIGLLFGAPAGRKNLGPQNWIANRYGTFRRMEARWAGLLKKGHGVEVKVIDVTRRGETRPFLRKVKWKVTDPHGNTETFRLDFGNFETVKSRGMKGLENRVPKDWKGSVVPFRPKGP